MRCPRHDLAAGPEGTCVLCRREETPAPGHRPRAGVVALAVVASGLVAVLAFGLLRPSLPAGGGLFSMGGATGRSPSREGALSATNSAGRSGSFYLPGDYASAPLPLLVAIHGTGATGRGMVDRLRALAERERFIVVAPDSGIAPGGQATWEVASHPGEETEDHAHIRRCVDEVLAMPGVRVDAARTLVAGHSGGGSTAPYEASVDPLYTAFAVLHGGLFAGGLGSLQARGWFSTGSSDPLRPPRGVRAAADEARRAGFASVEYHEYAGGHDLGDLELRELVAWWLGDSRVNR